MAKTISDEHECEKALIGFFKNLDARNYDGVLDLLTDDSIWHRMADSLKGKDAILKGLKGRGENRATMHYLTNIIVTVDGENAVATSYGIAYKVEGDSKPVLPMPYKGYVMCSFVDNLKKVNGKWLIKEKSVKIVFSQ